jgi:hypothetical protein
MIWLLPHPRPLSRQQVVTCQSFCVSPVELPDRRRGGGGVKSYDGEEKAWSSIYHSILSGKDEMRRKADIQKHVIKSSGGECELYGM